MMAKATYKYTEKALATNKRCVNTLFYNKMRLIKKTVRTINIVQLKL